MSILGNLFKNQEEIEEIESQKAMARQKGFDEIRRKKLNEAFDELLSENKKKSTKFKKELPIVKASKEIKSTLNFFKRKLKQLELEWEAAYKNFSCWNKIKHSAGPDYSEIKTQIKELEVIKANFEDKYGDSLSELNDHFKHWLKVSERRIKSAYDQAVKVQDQHQSDIVEGGDLIRKASWCAALSIPVSASMDFITAHNVYDSLRKVNGNFSDKSDGEIWWETLWMAPESLQGLTSLTKGAYFEELVAANTGGELFEHFNNPRTDIVIDGVEMQIKATDNINYINSVDDHIPAIATLEVALATGSIDGGYTNEEISNSVDLALRGSVVDIPDTAIDAILTGVGGLGIFATIKGLAHAQEQYEKGGDKAEAYLEGAGVAITGTAKALVDTGEMVWKVAMSRPSRFIGRKLLKVVNKLTAEKPPSNTRVEMEKEFAQTLKLMEAESTKRREENEGQG